MGSVCKGKSEKQKLSCLSQVGGHSGAPLPSAELFLLSEVFISSPYCSPTHLSTCKPKTNEIKKTVLCNISARITAIDLLR